MTLLSPCSPYYCMVQANGYVLLHRLAMAQFLGRYLTDEEVVHHVNENITDNRIENLELFSSGGKHSAYHRKEVEGEIE